MSVTGLKKQFFRVKQNLDQNLGRAEKSEVLNDEELNLERRVELMKTICQNVVKKLQACLHGHGQGSDVDKRLKKVPEYQLSQSLVDSSVQLGPFTPSGQMFQLCGGAEGKLATESLQLELDVETKVLKPIQDLLDNDIPAIQKLKKQLTLKTLDMDAAKTRHASIFKQAQQAGNAVAGQQAKVDAARDEMEDAIVKCDQIKDQLATEMYAFVGKESELANCIFDLVEAQAAYHRKTLSVLDDLMPQIRESVEFSIQKPAFGQSLVEHLECHNRELSVVIEECITVLYDNGGLEEEGLFRLAGSASKIKKLKMSSFLLIELRDFVYNLKAAFNSNTTSVISIMDDIDLHVVASILKLYLRELPEPLLTFERYNEFMQAVHRPADQRLVALREVVDTLPRPHYRNLRYLIRFLSKLSENSAINKMTPSNIAVVMGPNLMWPSGETGPNMMATGMQSIIVETLVANAEFFFPGDVCFSSCNKPSTASVISPHAAPFPDTRNVVSPNSTSGHPFTASSNAGHQRTPSAGTLASLQGGNQMNAGQSAAGPTATYSNANKSSGAHETYATGGSNPSLKAQSKVENRSDSKTILLYIRSSDASNVAPVAPASGSSPTTTLKRTPATRKPPAPQPPTAAVHMVGSAVVAAVGRSATPVGDGDDATIPNINAQNTISSTLCETETSYSGGEVSVERDPCTDSPPSPRLERPRMPPPERPPSFAPISDRSEQPPVAAERSVPHSAAIRRNPSGARAPSDAPVRSEELPGSNQQGAGSVRTGNLSASTQPNRIYPVLPEVAPEDSSSDASTPAAKSHSRQSSAGAFKPPRPGPPPPPPPTHRPRDSKASDSDDLVKGHRREDSAGSSTDVSYL